MGSNIDVSSTGALVNRLLNPPNPMEQLGQTVGGVNALLNFQAQRASADAYRQSVDPNTGDVDLGKYKALLSQGPGAYNFGPLVTSGGQAVGAVGQGTTADIGAKLKQIDAVGQMMFPLLRDGAQNQQIDPALVQAQLDQASKTGLITPQQYQQWSGQLKGMTPSQAYGFVLGANEGNEGARAFLQPNMFNQGPRAININPSSPVAPGGIPLGLSPAEQTALQKALTAQTSWPDPNDPTKTKYGPESERLKELYGVDPSALIGGAVPPGGGAPVAPKQPEGTTGAQGSDWEVQHNNFAGMRNPNVPAAGGPKTNPSGWQQFPTPEAGVQAISNQLDRYASGATTGKPVNTISGIVSTWAPPSDGNPTPQLIARAAKIVGVDPDQPLNLSDPAVKAKLVEAMIRNEQGGALPQTAATAIPKVFGGASAAAAPAVPAANLVPGGGAQLPNPTIQLADFPAARVGEMPVTLPDTAKASGQQYTADLGNYNQLPARLAPLQQASAILQATPNLGTGTGAGDIQRLASLASNFGFTLSPAATTNLAAFTELNKDLERYYLGLPGGQRSDLAQAETKMSQPSTEMQRQALEDLIPKTIGLERANSAGYLNFLQQHGQANAANYAPQYQTEAAAYRNKIDPVAFGFDYMTAAQRKAYLDSLPTAEAKQRYLFSIKEASRLYNLPISGQ